MDFLKNKHTFQVYFQVGTEKATGRLGAGGLTESQADPSSVTKCLSRGQLRVGVPVHPLGNSLGRDQSLS